MSPEPSHPVGQPKGPKETPGPIRPARNRDREARRNGRRSKGKRRSPPEPQQIPPEEDQTDTSGPDGPPGAAEAADDEHVVDYLA